MDVIAKKIADNAAERLLDSFQHADRSKQYKIYLFKSVIKRILKYENKIYFRRFFWENGLLAQGLIYYVNDTNDQDILDKLIKYYNGILKLRKHGQRVFHMPDQIIHAYVMTFLVYEYGMKEYEVLLKEAADFLKKKARNSGRNIVYYRDMPVLYIDTLGMIIDFCIFYGEKSGDQELLDIAYNQIDITMEKCIVEGQILPKHGFDFTKNIAFGSNTWGRGIGWYILGLSSVMEHSALKNRDMSKLINMYNAAMEMVLSTQTVEGYLCNDIETKDHIDTSTTSMIAFGLWKGLKYKWISSDYETRYMKLIKALLLSTDEHGNVNDCSGECIDIGLYSNKYGCYYAQGHTLMCLWARPEK